MNEGTSDIIMTVEEVSEYLKLAQSTIYKLLSEGKLPGRKIGGSWRFSRRALDEWIEGGMVGERQSDSSEKDLKEFQEEKAE
jgi:excisionase family DNA binding protein